MSKIANLYRKAYGKRKMLTIPELQQRLFSLDGVWRMETTVSAQLRKMRDIISHSPKMKSKLWRYELLREK